MKKYLILFFALIMSCTYALAGGIGNPEPGDVEIIDEGIVKLYGSVPGEILEAHYIVNQHGTMLVGGDIIISPEDIFNETAYFEENILQFWPDGAVEFVIASEVQSRATKSAIKRAIQSWELDGISFTRSSTIPDSVYMEVDLTTIRILAGEVVLVSFPYTLDNDVIIPDYYSAVVSDNIAEYTSGGISTDGHYINDPDKVWPDGVITYVFEDGISGTWKTTIRNAFQQWEDETDLIDFVEWTDSDVPSEVYLYVEQVSMGCAAHMGYRTYATYRTLEFSSACTQWDLVHEAGHVIGLYHEHQRTDRDDSLIFIEENVINDSALIIKQYDILTGTVQSTSGVVNCRSVMMYPGCMYSFDEASCEASDGTDADYAVLMPIDSTDCNLGSGSTTQEDIRAADIAAIELMYETDPEPCTGCGC